MKYNGTINQNMQCGSERVHIYTYSPQISFHVNQSTLWVYVFWTIQKHHCFHYYTNQWRYKCTLMYTYNQSNSVLKDPENMKHPTKLIQRHSNYIRKNQNTFHDIIISIIWQWPTSIWIDINKIKIICIQVHTPIKIQFFF